MSSTLHNGAPFASRGMLKAITSSIDRWLLQLLQVLSVNPYSSIMSFVDKYSVKCDVACDIPVILEVGTDEILEDTRDILEDWLWTEMIDFAAID